MTIGRRVRAEGDAELPPALTMISLCRMRGVQRGIQANVHKETSDGIQESMSALLPNSTRDNNQRRNGNRKAGGGKIKTPIMQVSEEISSMADGWIGSSACVSRERMTVLLSLQGWHARMAYPERLTCTADLRGQLGTGESSRAVVPTHTVQHHMSGMTIRQWIACRGFSKARRGMDATLHRG